MNPYSERKTLLELVAEAIGDRGPDDCWPWPRQINHQGYGTYSDRKAHRVVYEALTGQDVDDLQLDHLCHTLDTSCEGGPTCVHRRCCNPMHLDPCLPGENTARIREGARGRKFVNVEKSTQCGAGHEYTEKNTRWRGDGSRYCKACHRIAEAERRARKRAERDAARLAERGGPLSA